MSPRASSLGEGLWVSEAACGLVDCPAAASSGRRVCEVLMACMAGSFHMPRMPVAFTWLPCPVAFTRFDTFLVEDSSAAGVFHAQYRHSTDTVPTQYRHSTEILRVGSPRALPPLTSPLVFAQAARGCREECLLNDGFFPDKFDKL